MKDHASALADFERYVALVPKDDLGFYWRATAHYELGDLDAAMKDFDEAIRLDPDDAGNFNGRSFVWRNMGDDDKALADVDTAARLDPGYFDYQHNKCSLRLHLGREIETALSACDAALRISPRNHDTLSSRGIAYLLLDKPQEAKADFEACTQKLAARPEAERDEDNDRDVAFCRYGRAIATGRIEGGRNGPNGNQISEDMRTAFGLSPGVVSTFDAYGIVR
jgi:tetratricopeptide (TPR) repeat protein